MSFQEMLAEIQTLKLAEKRAQTADYLEVVVERDHLGSLCKILESYFGVPLKPEGQAPSGKASQLAEPYGGIREDQTMYCLQGAERDEFALLWPWGNGIRITAKIIQASPSPKPCGFAAFLSKLFCRKS